MRSRPEEPADGPGRGRVTVVDAVHLAAVRPVDQPGVRILRGGALVADRDDLVGDRRLDTSSSRPSACTMRQLLTPSATWFISAMTSSMVRPSPSRWPTVRLRDWGEMQVAMRSPMPGEAGERQRRAAQGDAEAGDLGQAAGDDRRAGVVAGAEAVGHARRDGDDVLERAAELAADEVVVGVDAEQVGVEHVLQRLGHGVVVHRHHRCRRGPGRGSPWPGSGPVSTPTGWPGSSSWMTWVIRMPGVDLEPLGQADHRDPRPHVGRGVPQGLPERLRRHAHDQQIGAARAPRRDRWSRSACRAGRSRRGSGDSGARC